MKNIFEYLEKAAKTTPDRIALSDGDEQLTYEEYYKAAVVVSEQLAALGYLDGARPIGVVAKHCIWTPVFYLGIVKSGNFYVPLDPDLPEKKRDMIIESSGMCHILSGTAETLQVERVEHSENSNIEYSENSHVNSRMEQLGDSSGNSNMESPDCPLYLIYTSGSTGVPKGVWKGHEAVMDYVTAFSETYPFEAEEVMGNQTPFFFDASAKDIYLSLYNAATLEIIPAGLFSFPVKLIEYLNEKKITMISWVPSALSIITKLNAFQDVKPVYLRKVFFVGEVFPMKQLNKWRREMPDLSYVNLYGSTEIAGICCHYPIPSDAFFGDTDSLPVGGPLKNCKVVLMKDGKPVTEVNESGEICVSSKALAMGYYKDDEKTEAAFVMMDPDGTGRKHYLRTGDMAFYNEKREIVFASRKDFQIKHMGHRIELGEIEAVASGVDGIMSCGCIYDNEKQKIVLFCEVSKEGDSILTGPVIRNILREKLSSYMVPGKVVIVEHIPLNANGKIDRVTLKEQYTGQH